MVGCRRTPITPLQVGAIKEMVANKQLNGDSATFISHNRRTDAYVATATRGYGGLADNVNRSRTNVVSECELSGLRLTEQDAPFASLAENNEWNDTESINTAGGRSPPHWCIQTMQKAVKGLGLSSRSPAKKVLLVCQQGHTPRGRGTAVRGPTTGCWSSSPRKAPLSCGSSKRSLCEAGISNRAH